MDQDNFYYPLYGTFRPAIHKTEYLRKEFTTLSGLQSERLYITSKGVYQAYLNGTRIGNDFMAPGWTPSRVFIETRTYNVTNHLSEGNNAIGVILGEGWYAGKIITKLLRYPTVKPQLLVQLELTYQDGNTSIITSDSTWRAFNEGPIRNSQIYDGER